MVPVARPQVSAGRFLQENKAGKNWKTRFRCIICLRLSRPQEEQLDQTASKAKKVRRKRCVNRQWLLIARMSRLLPGMQGLSPMSYCLMRSSSAIRPSLASEERNLPPKYTVSIIGCQQWRDEHEFGVACLSRSRLNEGELSAARNNSHLCHRRDCALPTNFHHAR